jgi:hypothetical protein
MLGPSEWSETAATSELVGGGRVEGQSESMLPPAIEPGASQ